MITRCPACATAFRVQRAQLAARAGKVRCGKCATVFDGIAALLEDSPEPLRLEPSPQLGLFDPSRRPPPPARVADDEEAPLPAFMLYEEPRRRRRLWWGAAAFLAAAALAAQAAYHYRTELALSVPEARTLLDAVCGALGCEVRLPRRPELMSIESSDLQADTRREGVIVLNAVIRNRARFAQEYPALELTLTDDGERPLLRRVLGPADYLDPGRAPQGIAGGAETTLRIYLDAGRARATGYRLYLFYPA